MAQLNITLDQDEILRLMADDSGDAFKELLRASLNGIMRAESAEQLRAEPYERTEKRTDSRNGTRRLGGGFDDSMTVMALPRDMRRCTRTSNYLERLNREVRRRSKVIGVFPNAASALRLMGALLMEENDRWASMRKVYYSPACRELEERAGALVELARRQQDLRKAA